MSKQPPSKPVSRTSLRWWDPFTALLLVAVLQITAMRLIVTRWTPELQLVQWLSLLGVILGLALGKSRFHPLMAALFELLYGLLILIWQLASLSDEPQLLDRILAILTRVEGVMIAVIMEKQLTDSIIFVILMSVVFWILSTLAGFTLVRYASPWLTIFPTGVTLFVIHYYYNCPYNAKLNVCVDSGLSQGAWYLAAFLFFSLLLIARTTYLHRFAAWRQHRAHISAEVSYDLMRYALGLAFVVILVAWLAPVVRANPVPLATRLWDAAGTPMRRLSDWVSPLFESIRASVAISTDDFGSSLTLGRGGELSDQVTLIVDSPMGPTPGVPFYWRNRVYDQYVGDTWNSTYTETIQYDKGSINLPLPSELRSGSVNFTFKPSKALFYLYTPNQPLGSDVNMEIEYAMNQDGTADISALRALDMIGIGETYQVRVATRSFTMMDLREAGTVYPEWVVERYLQIPDTITERTRQLAVQIAGANDNPFDVAQAVTRYLRENLEYQEVLDELPTDRELIDWVLFEYRKGFCNYYASAQVILLRSLGSPARIVVGYAQGERQLIGDGSQEDIFQQPSALETGPQRFVVRAQDAHAWPEVYFPGIGWVEFEPTVSRSEIRRPSGESSISSSDAEFPPVPSSVEPTRQPTPMPPLFQPRDEPGPTQWAIGALANFFTRWWWVIASAAALVLLIWWAPLLVKLLSGMRRLGLNPPDRLVRWAEEASVAAQEPLLIRFESGLRRFGFHPPRFLTWWTHILRLTPVERAYREINLALNRLGVSPAVDNTPAERVASLAMALPEVSTPANDLLFEYQSEIYSTRKADLFVARQAASQIRKFSTLAWFQRLLTGRQGG